MPRTTAQRTFAQPTTEPAARAIPKSEQQQPTQTAIVATHKTRKESAPHEIIKAKAYELWRARGGDALTNWLEAEAIVNGKQTASTR